jgi:hypothetical protein
MRDAKPRKNLARAVRRWVRHACWLLALPPPGPPPWWAIEGGVARYDVSGWMPRAEAFSFWLGEDG